MWGWLDGLLGGIKSVWETLVNIPQLIGNALKGFFDNIVNSITNLGNTIGGFFTNLLNGVLDGIKGIFIPDTEYIENAFGDFTDNLKRKFNFDFTFFENLFQSEQAVQDIYVDYSIAGVGDFNFKVLDAEVLTIGVDYFRPIVRGFLVLLIALYNVSRLIGFFGYNAGVVAGRSDAIDKDKDNQKKGRL